MNTYERFYTESLYPIQDGVLGVVKSLNTPFYLTGGTALSRHYLGHRYSDDIDLFVNDDPSFGEYVTMVVSALEEKSGPMGWRLLEETFVKAPAYFQINLAGGKDSSTILKIDLVSDVASHYGGYEKNEALGTVDGWPNILANKLSAVFRFEPKDIADIWALAKTYRFTWSEILAAARNKEGGLDPSLAGEVINTIPEEALRTVKWARPIDYAAMRADLERISMDILEGGENRVYMRA